MKVGIIVVFLTMQFMGSSAQQGLCWNRLSTCFTLASSTLECCPLIKYDIQHDKECFCSAKALLHANATLASAMSVILSSCEVPSSYDTLCPDVVSSTPTLDQSPDITITPNVPSADSRPTGQSSAKDSTSSSNGGKLHIIIPIVIVGLVVVIVTVTLIICLCIRKKKLKGGKPDQNVQGNVEQYNYVAAQPQTPSVIVPISNVTNESMNVKEDVVYGDLPKTPMTKDDIVVAESLQYELRTLQAATNNFSDEQKLGRGGFGVVYKGGLADGTEIAVKRLSDGSSQGDKEFKNEVVLLAKLQHRNLVRLVGFCVADVEKLLVYEFVPNKSLDYFIFDSKKQEELNWPMRYNIIKGVARAMLYLHDDSPTRIIHRDLKAANVLLDAEMNPKVADFGMARICANNQTHIDTSRVVGTSGYMAPEYLFHGQFSIKSDVYSFGALVLEIVSGRRVTGIMYQSDVQGENLLTYAWRCWFEEKTSKLMDPTLRDSCSTEEVMKCVNVGLMCVQEEISKRPTMETIVHELNSSASDIDSKTPSMLQPPAYLYNSSSDHSTATRSNTCSTGTKSNTHTVTWSRDF